MHRRENSNQVERPTFRPGREIRPLRSSSRIVLIETHALLRESLAHSLEKFLVGMTVEACVSVDDVQPGSACLVLIRPSLERSSSNSLRELLLAVRQICHRAPVGAILRRSDDDGKLRDLQPLGLAGVVEDNAGVEIVVAAARLMIAGATCFPRERLGPTDFAEPGDPVLAAPVVAQSAPHAEAVLAERPVSTLTLRENQILSCLREGSRNKVIAFDLGISESTVKVHVRNILKKLKASNRTQVALSAARADLV